MGKAARKSSILLMCMRLMTRKSFLLSITEIHSAYGA